MAERTIANPAGSYGLPADNSAQDIMTMVNASGGTVKVGDIVIFSDVNGAQITRTTTAQSPLVCGVVGEPQGGTDVVAVSSGTLYPAGALVPVVIFGPARVNVAANAVAAGGLLATSAVAGVAAVPATPAVGSTMAKALEANAARDANNCIRAFVGTM